MNHTANNLEASSDVDVPLPAWTEITAAASRIAAALFPDKVVALRVMGDEAIQRLNRFFRNVDSVTDVLSFPAGVGERPNHAGDIALSWETVERQATQNGNSAIAEAVALIAHGMLHVAGWDHPDDPSQEAFDQRTRELCQTIGIEVEVFGH